jgi:nucleoside-diphosphate-sugar epimerase
MGRISTVTVYFEHPLHFFVTGGSGYIGRNLLRKLVAQGHTVSALTRSEDSAQKVHTIGADPVQGDMLDKQALLKGIQGADFLLHLAADTNHSGATRQQEETNLKGTKTVFEAARQAGIRRALHLSSEAVLLTGKPLRNTDETTPIPNRFPGGYSRTKAMAEQIALAAVKPGFDVVVLRPRFVWGRDDSTALPQLVEAAQSGKLAWIDGGEYLTSTTHVENVVHAMLLALEKGRTGEVYFVTDGEAQPFRAFITRLLATQGIKAPTKKVPRWLVVPVVRLGEIASKLTGGKLHGPMSWQEYATLGVEVTLNIKKARSELGYAPVISIDEGMAELRSSP